MAKPRHVTKTIRTGEGADAVEHTYTYHKLTTTPAQDLLLILQRALGPVIAAGSMAASARELATRLTREDLIEVRRVLGAATQHHAAGGARPVLDLDYQELHFSDCMLHMLQWVQWCLEVQFSDFFGEFKRLGLVPQAPGKVPSPSESPPTSTG